MLIISVFFGLVNSSNAESESIADKYTQVDILNIGSSDQSTPEAVLDFAPYMDSYNPYLPYQQERLSYLQMMKVTKQVFIERWVLSGRKAMLKNLEGDLSWANGQVVIVRTADRFTGLVHATLDDPEYGNVLISLHAGHLRLLNYY